MRLAIVSGGSRGLGEALCQRLQQSGYTLLELSRSAPHSFSLSLDFADPASAQAKLADALASLSRQSWDEILYVHCAATLDPIGPASRKASVDVLANLNTNFTTSLLIVTAVVAAFQQHACRKCIANVSSGAATKPYAGWSLYCAGKAGVEHFIRALAVEQALQAQPFAAININPGVIDTDMQAGIRATTAEDFPDVARFIQRHADGGLRPAGVVADALLNILRLPDLQGGMTYDVANHLV
ncbi:MAG: SDR family NAD(P)-dependent oxidoreductase [Rhodocyclaceae bacterium]